MRLRLGTRGSRLARSQSGQLARALEELGHEVTMVIVHTAGDLDQASSFQAIGPAGIFVREIERALLDEEIDLAVHSYKDLPSASPEGLTVAAVPERADPADCLILRQAALSDPQGSLQISQGGRVGTSSARRVALLRDLRPDLVAEPIRGNVPTRVGKVLETGLDAVVLAAAGLDRLVTGGSEEGASPFSLPDGLERTNLDPTVFVPAPAQGALALQVRSGGKCQEAVSALDVPTVHHMVEAERHLSALVEGDCTVPIGAWCREAASGEFKISACLGVEDRLLRASGVSGEALALAEELATELLSMKAALLSDEVAD